ncbi:MAG: helix-turn-helix domain-containing protein [Chitinophagaceae bacterium]|jgi:transcriptional regulator with XRE-family HTH domain|nr:helix-turn-helix domain-containing protein [Chitinophagaceae bacterium]
MKNYSIGANIRKYRSMLGKKQEVLAAELGISRVMLSRYENGHVNIKFNTLKHISLLLCVNIELLIKE